MPRGARSGQGDRYQRDEKCGRYGEKLYSNGWRYLSGMRAQAGGAAAL